jgi:hypothetical protein
MIFRACLAAMVMVVIGACGSHPSSPGGHHAVSPRPVSCRQQYQAWEHGPAKVAAANLKVAVTAALAAEKSRDVRGMRAAMRRLMPDAVALAYRPLPRCADPAGINLALVPRSYAAGHKARSASGLSGLLRAVAMLKGVPDMEHQLTAEAARVTGKS